MSLTYRRKESIFDFENRFSLDAWERPKAINDYSLFQGMFNYGLDLKKWKIYKDGVPYLENKNYQGDFDIEDAKSFQSEFDLNCFVDGGRLYLNTYGIEHEQPGSSVRYTLYSIRHLKYQPNRGHLVSFSQFLNLCHFQLNTLTNQIFCDKQDILSIKSKLYAGVRRTFSTFENEDNFQLYKIQDGRTDNYNISNIGDLDAASFDFLHEIPKTITDNFTLHNGNISDIQLQWRGVGNIYFYWNKRLIHEITNLGKLSNLSIANPCLPVFFEVETKNVTLPNTERNFRWGIGTEFNRVFFECKIDSNYMPSELPLLRIGCVDVTSEGGNNPITISKNVVVERTLVKEILCPVLAIKIPEKRIVKGFETSIYRDTNGNDLYGSGGTTYNTRDAKLHSINTGQNDEQYLRIYKTRRIDAVTPRNRTTWNRDADGNYEYLIGNSQQPTSQSFNYTPDLEELIFSTMVEMDIPYTKTFESIYLCNGDYLIIMMLPTTPGNDVVNCTVELLFEE